MKRGSAPIAAVGLPVVDGYGENTLVWEPQVDLSQPPSTDTTYTVSVQGVIIGGVSRDFVYAVTVFDPGTQHAASGKTGSEEHLGSPIKLP
jgi:hypothetical protein